MVPKRQPVMAKVLANPETIIVRSRASSEKEAGETWVTPS